MTRKHFIIIARALGKDLQRTTLHREAFTPESVQDRYGNLIDSLYECNPSFDRGRFVSAIIESAEARRSALAAA